MSTATATVFVKDERTENWLKSHDVKYVLSTIKIADIDRRASLANQARDTALVPEAVDSYRQALRNGDSLPAIVVHKVNGKYCIVDGNNRYQAAADEKALKGLAYVIDAHTPSETITLLTVSANALNGVRVDKSWALTTALYLVDIGYTREAAAKALTVSVSAVNAHEKERQAGHRAHSLNVSGWNTMQVRVRQIIGRIKLDKAFVIVAEAAIGSNITYSADLSEFVTKVNAASSESEAITLATEWARAVVEHAKQQQRLGKKRSTHNPRLSLVTGLGKVASFNMSTFNASFATDEDRSVIKDRIQSAMAKLIEMSYRLDGKDETEEMVLTIVEDLGSKE